MIEEGDIDWGDEVNKYLINKRQEKIYQRIFDSIFKEGDFYVRNK
jgi:hypothetical protein